MGTKGKNRRLHKERKKEVNEGRRYVPMPHYQNWHMGRSQKPEFLGSNPRWGTKI